MVVRYIQTLTPVAVTTLILFAIGLHSSPSLAAGPYIGADLSAMRTELDYAWNEDYSTSHVRVKAGYEFSRFFAAEAQFYSSGDDSDYSFFYGEDIEYDSGNMVGVFVKPQAVFSKGYVNGLVGLLSVDSELTWKTSNVTGSDSNTNFAIGVGGGFVFAKRLRLGAEYTIAFGEAEYDGLKVDTYHLIFNAGLGFYF